MNTRKTLKINDKCTFGQFWCSKQFIEEIFPHIHVSLNTHTKEFEAVTTKSRIELNEEYAIHELSKELR